MNLTRYPNYKNSGIEWIGDIPDSWNIDRIKASIKSCNNGIWGDEPNGDSDDTICIRVADFNRDNLSVDISEPTLRLITERERSNRFLKKGDLLIEKSGGGENQPVGCVVLYNHDAPAVCSNFIAKMSLKPGMYPSFWKYIHAAAYSIRLTVGSINQTSGIQNLDQDRYFNEKVPFPSFGEQQKIAEFLDRETAKIDELIQKQENLIELYRERINALVLDGLANSGTKYIRLMHASEIIHRPVSQEDDSSYKPLGLYNRGRGIFIKEERETDDMGDSDFFWIKCGDLIFSGQFAWEGAVAMAQVEHDGCVVSHRYPVIRGKEGIALTEYLLALFQTSHGDFLLNENSRGAAGRNKPLNISLLLKEKIPIINMQSQLKIKMLIESKEQFLKKSIEQISLLKEHRASLISTAVTGKFDVRGLV